MENVSSENGTNRLAPSPMHLKEKEQEGLYSLANSAWRVLCIVRERTQHHSEIHIYLIGLLEWQPSSWGQRKRLTVGALAYLSIVHSSLLDFSEIYHIVAQPQGTAFCLTNHLSCLCIDETLIWEQVKALKASFWLFLQKLPIQHKIWGLTCSRQQKL